MKCNYYRDTRRLVSRILSHELYNKSFNFCYKNDIQYIRKAGKSNYVNGY